MSVDNLLGNYGKLLEQTYSNVELLKNCIAT